MNKKMNESMNECIDEWINDSLDKWINLQIFFSCTLHQDITEVREFF